MTLTNIANSEVLTGEPNPSTISTCACNLSCCPVIDRDKVNIITGFSLAAMGSAPTDDFAGLKVGVLELQGDFAEHTAMLYRCGVGKVVSVRQQSQLTDDLDALVIPGGESTVIGKLLCDLDMMDAARKLAQRGLPMFGTCAGCIILAADLPLFPNQPRIGAMNIAVDRNAYGSQIDSFETHVVATGKQFIDNKPLHVVQIRAPAIVRSGDGVQVLAEHGGRPILVRQGTLLSCTFHPELTNDTRVHSLFLEMVAAHKCGTDNVLSSS